MAANYPEIWLAAVRKKFNSLLAAAWLIGIPEISAETSLVNAGSATEKNIIHVPNSTFAPDVLINNTTYPIDAQAYTDDTITLTLDKYQTKKTTLSDDQTLGSSYDMITEATRTHVEAIVSKKYVKALHAIAPASNATATPVMVTTGDTIGLRKRLCYADLVAFKALLDAPGVDCPAEGRRLVLCTDHFNDLLLDRVNFGDKFINYETGKIINVLGFEIYQYNGSPYYTTAGVKVAWGAVNPAGAKQASVFFSKDNIGIKTGITKQYFVKAENNPSTQANEINYRHYYIAMPFLNTYIGAILSATVAP